MQYIYKRAKQKSAQDSRIHNRLEIEVGQQDPIPDESLSYKANLQDGDGKGSTSDVEDSKVADPNLVTWDGDDDPENPLNWPATGKSLAATLVALITLMPGITSSICSPASQRILEHFNNHNEVMGKLITSVMLLTWGFAGAVMAPLSEVIGRKWVFVIGAAGGLAFDLGCAFAPNMAALIVFRGLSGAFNIVPLVLGAGCIADLFVAEKRLWPLAWWSLAPSMGPVIGPLIGSLIVQWTSWKWTFITAAAAQGAFGILILLFYRESYAPVLLARKRRRLVKETGNQDLFTIWDLSSESFLQAMVHAGVRPILFLFTDPIIFGLGLFLSFVYALLFLVLTTYSTMWINLYHYRVFISGLMYIGLAVGMVIGVIFWTYMMVSRIESCKKRGKGTPEDYLFYLPLSSVQMCIGLFWYGWSAEAHVHWIMPQIGIALFAAGITLMFQVIQPYIVLLNPRLASSAIAAVVLFRCEMACAFPLFGQQMYDKLGYGWGNTLVALLILVIGVPYPIVLIWNGAKLRQWISTHSLVYRGMPNHDL